MLQPAGGGLGEDAGIGRAVPLGQDERLGAEGGGGADDGADIVRVGHLVEHDDEARLVEIGKLGLGEGIGKDCDPLMHRAGPTSAVDLARVDRLGKVGDAELGEALQARFASPAPFGCGGAGSSAPRRRCASHR